MFVSFQDDNPPFFHKGGGFSPDGSTVVSVEAPRVEVGRGGRFVWAKVRRKRKGLI